MPPPASSARTTAAAQERLAETVHTLYRGWMRDTKEEARQRDLTLPQLFLLGVLEDVGTLSVTRWAESLGTPPSTTTGLLDGLEAGGYVTRTHDPTDRRQVLVSLAPRGHRLAEELRAKARVRWSVLCEGIPARELDSVASTLRRIADRMDVHPTLAPLRTPRVPPRLARPARRG